MNQFNQFGFNGTIQKNDALKNFIKYGRKNILFTIEIVDRSSILFTIQIVYYF